ncbi:NAD(P)-binding protein [Clavulina sp. PMI_390]|nr:NAD(P)-binding protein [Clavulina sp. PMI_390]
MSLALPLTQQAWRAHTQGQPRKVITLDEIPVPRPGPGQALVKVNAAALNPAGFNLLRMIPNFIAKRPQIVEYDYCGTVIESNGSPFKPDDIVWGCTFNAGGGTMAQYILVDKETAALKPKDLSVDEAAGLAMIGVTAEQAIYGAAGIRAGQTILVIGGSSGVGSLSIRMLKHLGCTVYASCSTRNIELVRSLGADVVYDYTIAPLRKQIIESSPMPKFDAILDLVGPYDVFIHCEDYLLADGNYVNMGTPFLSPFGAIRFMAYGRWLRRPAWLGGTPRKWEFMAAKCNSQAFARLNAVITEGSIAPTIDSVHEWDDLMKAYDRIMTGRTRGKVIVRVP